MFYRSPIFVRVVQQIGRHEFITSAHEKVSIFGAPSARVSFSGLVWEIENTSLRFPSAASLLIEQRTINCNSLNLSLKIRS